jgi:hypothetical protein
MGVGFHEKTAKQQNLAKELTGWDLGIFGAIKIKQLDWDFTQMLRIHSELT